MKITLTTRQRNARDAREARIAAFAAIVRQSIAAPRRTPWLVAS